MECLGGVRSDPRVLAGPLLPAPSAPGIQEGSLLEGGVEHALKKGSLPGGGGGTEKAYR